MVVDIFELKKLNREDGEALLIREGYIHSGSGDDTGCNNESDHMIDDFFYLYGDDEEELDKISYVTVFNTKEKDIDEPERKPVDMFWERVEG